MGDPAWIKKYFEPFVFPESEKFVTTDHEETQETKVNHGVDMMRCRVQTSSGCH